MITARFRSVVVGLLFCVVMLGHFLVVVVARVVVFFTVGLTVVLDVVLVVVVFFIGWRVVCFLVGTVTGTFLVVVLAVVTGFFVVAGSFDVFLVVSLRIVVVGRFGGNVRLGVVRVVVRGLALEGGLTP